MTRSELVERLHARFPVLTPDDARSVVNVILAAIGSELAIGNRIEIRGFGSFELHYRNPKLARNPKTGEKVQVPGKYRAHFKAGKELRERVDFR
jgi:integration host factor subunit beta